MYAGHATCAAHHRVADSSAEVLSNMQALALAQTTASLSLSGNLNLNC